MTMTTSQKMTYKTIADCIAEEFGQQTPCRVWEADNFARVYIGRKGAYCEIDKRGVNLDKVPAAFYNQVRDFVSETLKIEAFRF